MAKKNKSESENMKFAKKIFKTIEEMCEKKGITPGCIGLVITGDDCSGKVRSIGGFETPNGASMEEIKSAVRGMKKNLNHVEKHLENLNEEDEDDDDLDDLDDDDEEDEDDDDSGIKKILLETLVMLVDANKKEDKGNLTKKEKKAVQKKAREAYEAAREWQEKKRESGDFSPKYLKKGDELLSTLEKLLAKGDKALKKK